MSTIRYPLERGGGGGWNLPGVRDLLHPQDQPISTAVAAEPASRQSFYEPRYEKTYQRAHPGQQLQINTQAASRRLSTSTTPGPSPLTAAIPSPAFPLHQQSSPSHYIATPHTGYHHSQPAMQPSASMSSIPYYPEIPSRPRMMSSVSNSSVVVSGPPLSAARIASNHRHKTSEKQRRDGNGSLTQAGHVLRSGMTPALLFKCSTCASSPDSEMPNPSSLPTPQSSFSSAPAQCQMVEPKTKIPKNDILYHSILWEFDVLLHNGTHDVIREKVNGVRTLAMSMEDEKMAGLRNSMMNKDGRIHKWSSDVRGEVLLGVVERMEASCREHGITIGEDDEPESASRWREVSGDTSNRKRERDGSETYDDEERYAKRSQSDVPTPPSSRGSPTPVR